MRLPYARSHQLHLRPSEKRLVRIPLLLLTHIGPKKLVGSLLDLAPRGVALSESCSRLVRARGRFNASQDGECGMGPF
jgi:hypothetical protein